MGEVGESTVALAGAAALALLSKRAWAGTTALVVAGLLLAVSVLAAFTQMTYFSMRSACFAMAFASVAGVRRQVVGTMAACGALALVLVSAVWFLASGGTVHVLVGESVDPSQRARIFETIDASGGFLSTILVGLSVIIFTVWSRRHLTRS